MASSLRTVYSYRTNPKPEVRRPALHGRHRWLSLFSAISVITLVVGLFCALIVAIDMARGHSQRMTIMNAVWPINALYLGPLALWAYYTIGRSMTKQEKASMPHHANTADAKMRFDRPMDNSHRHHKEKPFWQTVFVGTMHCGAGCTLGDILAEFTIFYIGLTIAGMAIRPELIGDYALAFALGIVFQYFAIVPMRQLSPRAGIAAALKADALSLTTFEIGLFGWMVLMRFVFFHTSPLHPDEARYWFMMQIGMALGFLTSYPMNWWLITRGIKEAM